jgi:hypothetical protein
MTDFALGFLASCGAVWLGFAIGRAAAAYIMRRLD